MGKMQTAAIALGAILMVPVTGFAAPPAPGQTQAAKSVAAAKSATSAKSAASAKDATSAASHSVRGVVKSVDASTLVIERKSRKKTKEMTFALDATTHRDGEINVGSTVSVRYKGDASRRMAVDVRPVKTKSAAHKAAAD